MPSLEESLKITEDFLEFAKEAKEEQRIKEEQQRRGLITIQVRFFIAELEIRQYKNDSIQSKKIQF